MTAKQPTLTVDGVTLRLEVARKKVKSINVRLVGDELRVSAPRWVSARELDEAVDTLARRLVRRERAKKINGEDNALELARRVARRFPDPPEVAAARFSTRQGSRWGSYSTRTRTIHLNAAIRLMPPWVLEAVVAHEFAHTFHLDHSPAFWELVRSVCPKTVAFKSGRDG